MFVAGCFPFLFAELGIRPSRVTLVAVPVVVAWAVVGACNGDGERTERPKAVFVLLLALPRGAGREEVAVACETAGAVRAERPAVL